MISPQQRNEMPQIGNHAPRGSAQQHDRADIPAAVAVSGLHRVAVGEIAVLLRAYKAGQQVSPLADPGASDLTADVDFQRLRILCEERGLGVHGPVTQQLFLARLGARHRTESLVRANPARADEIRAAVTRLLDPDEMGARFHAIALTPKGAAAPPGF